MCRALVESALKDRFDSDHKVEYRLQPGESYFRKLVEKAEAELGGALSLAAEIVKKCGDYAAHNNPKFERECQSRGKLKEALGGARAILAALYPAAG